MKRVVFDRENPEFFQELRQRVNAYFSDNNITRFGNRNMVFKTIFMLALYLIPYILMLSGIATSFLPLMGLWVLMGFGMAGIGMSIMHDANHQVYSSNRKINTRLGYLINLVGGYHHNWIIQHNMLHHTYTNIEGFDEDIDTPVMRFSPDQEHKKIFKYQAFYGPFLYGLLTLNWLLFKDYLQVLDYDNRDLLKRVGTTRRRALLVVSLNKLWYIALFLILPMIVVDAPWWHILIGFFIMHFICGFFLSIIFQSAHVLSETSFYAVDENDSVENNWAIHQMRTTANFAHNSRFFSWFIGGLNYQVEHHLFPNICHVHYRDLSKIIKEVAAKHEVPYYEHKTFLAAVRSHFKLVHHLGQGKDLPLAA